MSIIGPTKPATIGATIGALAAAGGLPWDRGGGAVLVAPSALTAPTFAGVPVRGQTLLGTAGTYDGIPAPSLTYQWERDGSPIVGAVVIAHTLVSADDAKSITLVETATNSAGSVSQTTAARFTMPAWVIDDSLGFFFADLGVTESSLEITALANQTLRASPLPDLTQVTASRRFDLIASAPAFNGRAVCNGDGGDVLDAGVTTAWEMAADGDDLTWISLCSQVTTGAKYAISSNDAGTTSFIFLQARVGSGGTFAAVDSGSTSISDAGAVMLTGQAHVVAGVYTGAVSPGNDSLARWVDGVSAGPTTGDQGRVFESGTAPSALLVGARRPSASGGIDGAWRLAITIDRLITGQEDADLTAFINSDQNKSFPGVTQ